MAAAVSVPSPEAIPLRRRCVNLRARLARALGSLERQARDEEIGFSLRCNASVPAEVNVDADKLAWAVTALVGNALRYVPRASRLRAGGNVAVDVSCEAGALRIAISDNGPGMPPSALAAFNESADSEGATPALSLMRDIVEAHGGHLELTTSTDAFDHGTTVRLIVPLK